MTVAKHIALCADDYAMHPAVDAAVQQLTEQGRLSATSCMTTAPRWPAAARALPALRNRLSVGLHFNLTDGHGVAPNTGIGSVIAQAYTGRLNTTAMRNAWRQQLDAFEDALGTPPDYVDGHQHVHQLPTIRTVMLDELQRRYGSTGKPLPWIRSTAPAGALRWQAKAAIIALLGGYTLTRQLHQQGWPSNQGFGGVYGFDAATPAAYGAHMAQWLAACQDGSLLMCHPANAVVDGDAIGAQRPVEFAYLQSAAFGDLLAARGCQIVQAPNEILRR